MAAINQSVPPQQSSNLVPGNASPGYATPAHAVGSQFVQQYYTVLHSSPRYLHRFYTDLSSMTHSDGGYDGKPGRIFTVQNQKNIHEKVLELDFEEAVTEIWSVDSQYSAHDGVIVQVTGSLQCKGKPQRNFVQTFFLAVQEKGYYVLNDIFRYLRSAPQATPLPAPATVSPVPAPLENGYASAPPSNQVRALDARPLAAAAPATPPAPAQIPHMPVSAPSATVAPAHAAPSATPAPSAPAPVQPAQPVEPVHEAPAVSPPEPVPEPEEPAAEWPNPTEPEEEPEPEPEPQPEEAPTPQQPAAPSVPLTYAERLMANTNKQNTAAPSARPQPSAAPAAAHAPAPTQTNPKPTAPAPYNGIPNGNHHTENGYYSRDELPGTSVFVRNLPQDVTEEKLEAAFKEIGALRGAKPVNLKIQKGKESFAFVDFQDSTAQQAAIAGPVLVDGHQVTVVEKKPQFIKSRGRGPGPVRGGFRGGRDGGRGGRGDGGRTGPGGRFLERGASIGSERSESARGGRRGGRGGREGGPPGAGRAPRGRGEGRGERPAPAVAAA